MAAGEAKSVDGVTGGRTAGAGVCARCAQNSGTCCSLAVGHEEYCFPISATERRAMEKAGAGPGHFQAQENTPGFLDNLCRLFPGEEAAVGALFPQGGFHDRLAVGGNASGSLSCLLLGPQGCALPRQARPLYCRLFPFWVRGGSVLYFDFQECQAVRERRGPGQMYQALGMGEDEARALYASLRQAWGLPRR